MTRFYRSSRPPWAQIRRPLGEGPGNQVKQLCYKLLEFKPDLIITEKGILGSVPISFSLPSLSNPSVDLVQHVFS